MEVRRKVNLYNLKKRRSINALQKTAGPITVIGVASSLYSRTPASISATFTFPATRVFYWRGREREREIERENYKQENE
jgi:hypothetical protein